MLLVSNHHGCVYKSIVRTYHPSQHKLSRSNTLLLGQMIDRVHQLKILPEVLFAVLWRNFPEVSFLEIIWTFVPPTQKPSSKRRVRNDSDPQLPCGFQYTHFLDLQRKRTVFRLNHIDMVDFTSSSQRLCGHLTETEVLALALIHLFDHHLDHLLDRNFAVETVAVPEIDIVGPQPFQTFVDGCPDVFGTVTDNFRSIGVIG